MLAVMQIDKLLTKDILLINLGPDWKVCTSRRRYPPCNFDAFYIITIKFYKSLACKPFKGKEVDVLLTRKVVGHYTELSNKILSQNKTNISLTLVYNMT